MAEALQLVRNEASDLILDAAERLFAERGFEGATTRAIAEEAGVTLALIHYHHRSKEALFAACFNRRAEQINVRRRAMLAELPAHDTPLEALVEALVRPSIELGRASGARPHYGRMLAVVASGTDPRSRALTSAAFDDIARKFIRALAAARPELDEDRALTAYLFAVSISVSTMAATGRAADLAGSPEIEADTETLVAEAIAFITAGIEAIAALPARPTKGEPTT